MSIDTTKKIKQVTYNGKDIPLRGYDTSDATVTAGDMAYGVVAYGASGKVTGSTAVISSGGNFDPGYFSATVSKLSDTYLRMSDTNKMGKRIIDNGAVVRLMTPLSKFGNATAADVAKGKTFTSAAGFNVVGTASSSSGSSFEGASLAAYDELVYGVGFALNARNSYIVNIPDGEVVAIIEKRAFTYLDTAYSNVLNDNLKITGSTNGNLLYSEGTATSESRNLSITSFEF